MGGKNIAILTTFRDDDHAYSLCSVVNDQIKMLVDNGYKPVVLVTEGFKPERNYKEAELRFLPDQVRQNTVTIDKTFNEDVEKLEKALEENLKDIDVVICHDIIYQPDALKHNVAIRALAARTNLKFLHWIHSATSPYQIADERNIFPEKYKEVIKQEFPRSYYVFFNQWSISRIAKHYNVPESLVKIVHHPTDYVEFSDYHPISRKIVKDYNLLSKEYICIYPARLDTGKQLEYPIKLIATLKEMKYAVQFIAVDFHSSSNDPNDPKFRYRQKLKDTAIEWGLNEKELLFTSELMPETKVRVPYKVVRNLFDLSNIFFMSSGSESYSLITQEAGMTGNLLIVNRNFPPFVDIFGNKVLKFPCHSNVNALDVTDGQTNTTFLTEEFIRSHSELAKKLTPEKMAAAAEKEAYVNLAKEVIANTVSFQEITRRNLLRQRNPEYVFRNELEPLLHQISQQYDNE